MARGDSTANTPPTLSYLVDLKSVVETRHDLENTQIDRARLVRELRSPVPIDQTLLLVPGLQIHDPTATSDGFRNTTTLGLHFPKVTVTPRDPDSDTAQEDASDLAHWTEQMLRATGHRTGGDPHTLESMIDAVANDGAGWTKSLWYPDQWQVRNRLRLAQFADDPEDAPRRRLARQKFDTAVDLAAREAGPPILWRSVDVRNVYPVWYGEEVGEVLEVTQRPLNSVFKQYGIAMDGDGNFLSAQEVGQGLPVDRALTTQSIYSAGGSVTFLEHWTDEWCSYAALGRNLQEGPTSVTLKQFRHHYGRHPYHVARGLTMNHWRNRKCGWGMTQELQFLVELRSFLWTLMGNIAARDTFPLLQEVLATFVQSPAGQGLLAQGDDARGAPQIVRWGMREILKAKAGWEYRPIPFPEVAESIKMFVATIDGAIDRLSGPKFSGNVGDMSGAGFAVNQVLSNDAIKFGLPQQHIETTLCEVADFHRQLVRERVKETVWVFSMGIGAGAGWLGRGPKDLPVRVDMAVSLNPEQPSAQLIEQRMVHEAIDKFTMSRDQGIVQLGRDPAEVRRGVRMDKIRQSPLYDQLSDQALLAELGRGDLVALTMQATSLAQGGNPGAGVPPPGGQAGAPQGAPVQAMGGPGAVVPDMGNLAVSPQGQGAALQPVPAGGTPPGPVGGTRVGIPSMAGPPQRSQQGVQGVQPITP